MRFLLIGLGNPGVQFEKSRHNAGFSFIDAFMQQYPSEKVRECDKYILWQCKIKENDIFLVKPQTYMNLSGLCMAELKQRLGVPLLKTCVICDNMDLPVGRAKVKWSGGSGGQRGLQNIIDCVGKDFWRLIIGVGRPDCAQDVSNYVLGRFPVEVEQNYLALIDKIAQIFGKSLCTNGYRGLQQIVNSL